MIKAKHYFSVVFKNLPYTDEEWALRERWRREAWARLSKETQERVLLKPSYRKHYAPRKTRPVWSVKRGPICHNETEARKLCEQALANGAQQVEYSIYGDKGHVSTWKKHKGGDWYGKKPLRNFS